MARVSPLHGRAFVAQLSIVLGMAPLWLGSAVSCGGSESLQKTVFIFINAASQRLLRDPF